jgi:hypothetical protein
MEDRFCQAIGFAEVFCPGIPGIKKAQPLSVAPQM